MPELPEVTVNARNLLSWMRGKVIASVVPPPGTRELDGMVPGEFARELVGRCIVDVTRRGKWILVRFDRGALGIHLGMTGKFLRVAGSDALPRFARAVFVMSDGQRVCLVDPRRFGKLVMARQLDDLLARREISGLGPDVLSELTAENLCEALAKTSRSVKEALMDQRIAAGVGNIYSTEGLWRAQIHPTTPAQEIAVNAALCRLLLESLRAALQHGLDEYSKIDIPAYIEEGAPNPFFAYDRRGEACPRCKSVFESMVLGGRTTVYCPKCQVSKSDAPARAARRPSWSRRSRRRRS